MHRFSVRAGRWQANISPIFRRDDIHATARPGVPALETFLWIIGRARQAGDFQECLTANSRTLMSTLNMRATSRLRAISQQRFRDLVHGFIAFARACAQSVDIEEPKSSPPALDQPRLAQAVRDSGYARPPDAQHFGDVVLRQVEIVAIRDVAAPQQPAREPGLDGMGRIARRALLRLGQQEMLVQGDPIAQSGTLMDGCAKIVGTDDGCAAADLDDRSIDGQRPFETRCGSGDAIPPDRSGLHHVAGAQGDDQRDDAVMRKVRRLVRSSDIVERRFLDKVDDPEARKQRLLIRLAEASQESIGTMGILRHDEVSAFKAPSCVTGGTPGPPTRSDRNPTKVRLFFHGTPRNRLIARVQARPRLFRTACDALPPWGERGMSGRWQTRRFGLPLMQAQTRGRTPLLPRGATAERLQEPRKRIKEAPVGRPGDVGTVRLAIYWPPASQPLGARFFMSNNKDEPPAPPRCAQCGKTMRAARVQRFGRGHEIRSYVCDACRATITCLDRSIEVPQPG